MRFLHPPAVASHYIKVSDVSGLEWDMLKRKLSEINERKNGKREHVWISAAAGGKPFYSVLWITVTANEDGTLNIALWNEFLSSIGKRLPD